MSEQTLAMVLFSFFASYPQDERDAVKENFAQAIRDNRVNLSAEDEIKITRAYVDACSDTR